MPTLVSRKHGFCFIHVPKAAGTSVTAAILPLSDHPLLDRPLINKVRHRVGLGNVHLPGFGVHLFKPHASANDVRQALGENQYNSLFSFGFVRNPWDFYVSAYHYIRQTRTHPDWRTAQELEFRPFLRRWLEREPAVQTFALADKNANLIVSHVGRQETLTDDLQRISNEIGYPVSSDMRNVSVRGHYQDYYDADARDWVADANRLDCEIFGYRF